MAGSDPFEVFLTPGAERDLESIVDYITQHDSVVRAEYVLDQLLDAVTGLEIFPERGSCPKELLNVGIQEYRQVLFKPYRLIYRVFEERVVIYLIVDGRRDFQSLLERRLLG